jgi:hypothetical protein
LLSLLLLKPAAQKMMMEWNSSTMSSKLALPRLHIHVVYGAFHYFCCRESHLVFVRHLLV